MVIVQKKKHRQLRTVLCGRCRLLSHGHMVTAVGGNGGYAGGKQFVTAEELREKLTHLRHEKALIVKLVDIVDFNGSFLAHVRDLAGANPIILVVTKVDLLPKGTDFNCVGDWVVDATMRKKLNVLSVHLTSSKSLVGIAGVVSEIQKEKKGRDVYILGAANVGKSAFINAALKMLSYKDPVAAMARKYKPIQSAVPGTTVGPIQINAFLGGGKVYDNTRIQSPITDTTAVDHLTRLCPALRFSNRGESRLRGSIILRHQDFPRQEEFLWILSNLVFDLIEAKLHFILELKSLLDETSRFLSLVQKEVGVLLTPPSGEQVPDWTGLETVRQLQIRFDNTQRPACDVAISGLGWITVEPVSQALKELDSSLVEDAMEISLDVHVPKPVEIFVRPPLPVGKVGGEWYQYRDLTEKEEETRPKWYF
ncbi:NO-associated protein 1, chloroplastic/mitochondrial [Tanacetum coccineum]